MRDLRTFLQKFTQNCQNVYEPGEDSELLLECALREVRRNDTVLEVGGGSGYVSYFIMDKCRFLVATDINPFAVKCMKSFGIECIRTDLANGIRARFTLVLFNPPYLELQNFEKRGEWIERAIDGGKSGAEITVRFLREIGDNLDKDGRIIFVASSLNLKSVCREMERLGFRFKIMAKKKLFFEELYGIKATLELG